MKEFFRKQIVNLKRSPQNIPLVVLVVAFLVYSLNLTYISHTTSRIQGSGMGLYGFITMLLSMLSFVCFFNSFPRRKKPNMPMLILMFIMFAIIIFADIKYRGLIHAALTRSTAKRCEASRPLSRSRITAAWASSISPVTTDRQMF